MRLKSKRVLELMEQRGITEDMLHDICGVHYVRDNCMISQSHARRLSEVLDVDVPEIAERLAEGGKA